MALSIIPEAAVWSVSESGRAEALESRPLLLLMHGRGSHENDLFSLVPLLPKEAVVVSVRAPIAMAPDSYAWFPTGRPGNPDPVDAAAATEAVLDYLDTLPPAASTWLLGFSQGGVMVSQLLRFAPERFAASVLLSGFTVDGPMPADERLEELRPPLFWGSDPGDPVIPQFAIERSADWLPDHTTLTRRTYQGIGHSISREEIDDVNSFLADNVSSAQ